MLQIREISHINLAAKEQDVTLTIDAFYGIVIFMQLTQKEHNPPHIHAVYGEYEATFLVADCSLLKGEFPSKGTALVQEFISLHREELANMWETGVYKKLPPIK